MTEPKILSPQEALRALADGGKLTLKGIRGAFVQLNDAGELVDSYGGGYSAHRFVGFTLYTEPKPKRKVAPYYVEYAQGTINLEDKCFETDEQARKYFDAAVSVTRCTALEIEV